MFTKLLLTAAVVAVAWLVVRERWRPADDGDSGLVKGASPAKAGKDALMPRGAVKLAAYGVVVLMLLGTGVYLVQGWQRDREVLRVQVVNTYTGKEASYLARRGEINARSFVTLDGRLVQIAEMERLILSPQ